MSPFAQLIKSTSRMTSVARLVAGIGIEAGTGTEAGAGIVKWPRGCRWLGMVCMVGSPRYSR